MRKKWNWTMKVTLSGAISRNYRKNPSYSNILRWHLFLSRCSSEQSSNCTSPKRMNDEQKKNSNKVAAIMKAPFLESTIVQSATPTTLTERNIDQREHCSIMKNVVASKKNPLILLFLLVYLVRYQLALHLTACPS